MNSKQNAFQNAFQNASQLQNFNFSNTELGSQKLTFAVLILAFFLLAALIRAEARSRALLERLVESRG